MFDKIFVVYLDFAFLVNLNFTGIGSTNMSIDNLRETKIFISRFEKSRNVENLSFLISTL